MNSALHQVAVSHLSTTSFPFTVSAKQLGKGRHHADQHTQSMMGWEFISPGH
jgi:hypothetical protein